MSNELWDDPRITAYVMDEMSPGDRQKFEQRLAENDELAAAVEQAREVTGKLSAYYSAMPQQSLSGDQQAAVLQSAVSEETDVSVAKSEATRPWRRRMVTLALVASVGFVLFAIAIPAYLDTVQVSAVSEKQRQGAAMSVGDTEEFEFDYAMPEQAGADEAASDLAVLSKPMSVANGQTNTATPYDEMRESESTRRVAITPTEEAPVASAPFASSSLEPSGSSSRGRSAPIATGKGLEFGREQGKTASTPRRARNEVRMDDMSMAMGMDQAAGRTQGRKSEDSLAEREVPGSPVPPGVPGFGFTPPGPGDRFAPIHENEFQLASEKPLSTFSIDVDTASYAKVRSNLKSNRLPPPDAVRIEELINYFDYDYAGPGDDDPHPFAAAIDVTSCPWEEQHRLVRVGLQAKKLETEERPRCNLVFLIDTSGSMRRSNKLPLVIDGMKLLLEQLRKDDKVAIVVYAGSAGLVLDSTPVRKKKKIINALSALQAGGSTNGGAGIQLAYETARASFAKGGVNRVILCSDGDFNVGMTSTEALVNEARNQAKSGIDLTVLGFGMGNHNDAMMEKISNDAEGNYAFVDTLSEARKVLADQLTGTLVTVAKDVKIQIEFNPAVVGGYRLIGYENRMLAKEDFNDDRKDAGEIGAGHRVTALYEIIPAGADSPALQPKVDPLKYGPKATSVDEDASKDAGEESDNQNATDEGVSGELLTLKLRYKPPQGKKSTLMTQAVTDEGKTFEQSDVDLRFAAAVAGFGMQLRNSIHAGDWTYEDVIQVAESATGDDPHELRAEFVELAKRAFSLTVNEVPSPGSR